MILSGNVFSVKLEMDTGITVITPTNYGQEAPYQICYVLHGLCGNHSDLVHYTMLPVYANRYHCILVMPEAGRSFYTDQVYGQRFFSYVAEELPQICRDVFRLSGNAEDAAVIGVSMGGYGALKCALTYPERYGSCCAISPGCLYLKDFLAEMKQRQNDPEFIALWGKQFLNDFRAAFGEEFRWSPDIELLELAKQAAGVGRLPSFYAMCGTGDELLELNRRFSGEARRILPAFTYEEWEGNHDWSFFNQALEKALAFCCGKR